MPTAFSRELQAVAAVLDQLQATQLREVLRPHGPYLRLPEGDAPQGHFLVGTERMQRSVHGKVLRIGRFGGKARKSVATSGPVRIRMGMRVEASRRSRPRCRNRVNSWRTSWRRTWWSSGRKQAPFNVC
jgi:hypothetical protein